jgi:acyl carrier protein
MKDRIKKIISQTLKRDVNDDTSQDTCATWDSLHHLNLIVELEIEFDVSFEPEEIVIMKNVDAILKIIQTKL